MLADGERGWVTGIGICILGGRGLPWQMAVVYNAFCSCGLQSLFLPYSHILLDPGVSTHALQLENLCSFCSRILWSSNKPALIFSIVYDIKFISSNTIYRLIPTTITAYDCKLYKYIFLKSTY